MCFNVWFLGGTLPPPQQSPCFVATPRPRKHIGDLDGFGEDGTGQPRQETGRREDVGRATVPTEQRIENSRQWTQRHQTQDPNGVWSTKKQYAFAVRNGRGGSSAFRCGSVVWLVSVAHVLVCLFLFCFFPCCGMCLECFLSCPSLGRNRDSHLHMHQGLSARDFQGDQYSGTKPTYHHVQYQHKESFRKASNGAKENA